MNPVGGVHAGVLDPPPLLFEPFILLLVSVDFTD